MSAPGSAAAPAPRRSLPPQVVPAIALAALLLYNLAFTPGFLSLELKDGRLYGSLVDVLDQATPTMLAALGMALVIATAGVDLSVGAVIAIAGAAAARLFGAGVGALGALGGALALGLALGAWNGLLVAAAGVQPIVATLVLMVAGRGVAQLLTAGQILVVDAPALAFLGGGTLAGLPVGIWLVASVALALAALCRRTAVGLFVEAVGNNERASAVAGVNARAVKLFVYTLSGLCAGLAGLVVAGEIKAADANSAGLYLELDAILAVVLGGGSLAGGRFFLGGALLGALTIQTLTTTILTRGIPVELTLVVKALVVLAVCLLQSQALRAALARRRRR